MKRDNMQTYIVEYNYTPWGKKGGFKPTPDYYDYESVTLKVQDIDHLRLKIVNELAKGKPFRSHVYRPKWNGLPDYDSRVGDLYHYPHGYVWFIRDTKRGWEINPKTGKRMR